MNKVDAVLGFGYYDYYFSATSYDEARALLFCL